jgi:prepilin-type N-terminal cleavage/methylation domain-containing protein/prepilin-type processing-associated H-X9-DG protein
VSRQFERGVKEGPHQDESYREVVVCDLRRGSACLNIVRTNTNTLQGFTVLELMVVVAILAVLASLLLPALSRAKGNMKRAVCLNNLAQLGKGAAMYADDFNQVLFPVTNRPAILRNGAAIHEWTAYNPLMRGYVGLKSAPSPSDKLFACPADTFDYWPTNGPAGARGPRLHLRPELNFSSYAFNAGNAVFARRQFAGMFPGVMGSKLSAIDLPAKTVLLGEFAGPDGYSWHVPPPKGETHYNNAPCTLSFADGHVSYVKMYSGSNNPSGHLQLPFASIRPLATTISGQRIEGSLYACFQRAACLVHNTRQCSRSKFSVCVT